MPFPLLLILIVTAAGLTVAGLSLLPPLASAAVTLGLVILALALRFLPRR